MKACSALVQEPPVAVTPEVVSDMKAKHPDPSVHENLRLIGLRPVSVNASPPLTTSDIKDAIRSFPRGLAAGPSGLRPQHLKDALVPGWRDEVVRHVADLTNLLSQGRAPSPMRPWICGASLAALPKPDGSHRPIAAGDTWRRLTAKLLAKSHTEELRDYLEPLQLGVGTKMGYEAIIHTCRQWFSRSSNAPTKVLVTLDLSNAFKSVDRSAVLESVRRTAPDLAPWCVFCYRDIGHLLMEDVFRRSGGSNRVIRSGLLYSRWRSSPKYSKQKGAQRLNFREA